MEYNRNQFKPTESRTKQQLHTIEREVIKEMFPETSKMITDLTEEKMLAAYFVRSYPEHVDTVNKEVQKRLESWIEDQTTRAMQFQIH